MDVYYQPTPDGKRGNDRQLLTSDPLMLNVISCTAANAVGFAFLLAC